VYAHDPALQRTDARGRVAQTFPQAPQFETSVRVFAQLPAAAQ